MPKFEVTSSGLDKKFVLEAKTPKELQGQIESRYRNLLQKKLGATGDTVLRWLVPFLRLKVYAEFSREVSLYIFDSASEGHNPKRKMLNKVQHVLDVELAKASRLAKRLSHLGIGFNGHAEYFVRRISD